MADNLTLLQIFLPPAVFTLLSESTHLLKISSGSFRSTVKRDDFRKSSVVTAPEKLALNFYLKFTMFMNYLDMGTHCVVGFKTLD